MAHPGFHSANKAVPHKSEGTIATQIHTTSLDMPEIGGVSANRTVLIVYPHWPPSNLVGVHRVRLVANYLSECGWTPLILTVDEAHYEAPPAPELTQLVQQGIEVIKVGANPAKTLGVRTIGDIGLRAFGQLKSRARRLCSERDIDFIWFSIPSWYPPLMGNALKKEFQVPFGIDYQDPWVYPLPKGTSILSRAWVTQWAARRLEPIALKGCDLVTGINASYFEGALTRNPKSSRNTAAFQLGFDHNDHNREVDVVPPWSQPGRYLLYPGAFLPLSTPFYEALFQACQALIAEGQWPDNTFLSFIGTGRPDLPITAIAKEFAVESIVFESPERTPFLQVQQLLRDSIACLVIGSPEAHYSASKVFQCILSGQPIVAALHQDSEALDILKGCNASTFATAYDPAIPEELSPHLRDALKCLLTEQDRAWSPDIRGLDPYHAREAAKKLAMAMETVLAK